MERRWTYFNSIQFSLTVNVNVTEFTGVKNLVAMITMEHK
jgi:hypothetical protein